MRIYRNRGLCFFFLLVAFCSKLMAAGQQGQKTSLVQPQISRNYDTKRNSEQTSKIVWRKCPMYIKLILENREVFLECSEVHKKLKGKVASTIERLHAAETGGNAVFSQKYEEGGDFWIERPVQSVPNRYNRGRLRPGNFAAASIQFVFDDGTYGETVILPETEICDLEKYSLCAYTTLKYGREESFSLITYRNKQVSSFKQWLNLKQLLTGNPRGDLGAYTDTELQICADLFCGEHPQMSQILNQIEEPRKVRAVILHIYSERDPCGWCGPVLVKLSEKINRILSRTGWLSRDKNINNLQKKALIQHLNEVLKELPQLKKKQEGETPVRSNNFDDYSSFFYKHKSAIKKEIEAIKDTDSQKYKNLNLLYERLCKIMGDEDPSKGAKFWIVVSSDEETDSGARQIGIDWLYNRNTSFDDQPIVFRCSQTNTGVLLDGYLEIPTEYVVFALNNGGKFDSKKVRSIRNNLPNRKTQEDLMNDFVSFSSEQTSYVTSKHSLPIGICGLQNLGNTCYFNATMQALASLDSIQQFIQSRESETVEDGVKEIFHLLRQLRTGQGVIIPSSVDSIVQKARPQWNPGTQQDSGEFLIALLDCLSKGENSIKDIVTGQIQADTMCHRRQHATTQKEDFNILLLALSNEEPSAQEVLSLDSLLLKNLKDQEIPGYECLSCIKERQNKNFRTEATKKQKLTQLPKVLVVQLGRFNNNREKILSPVSYEESWTPTIGNGPQKTFKLKGIINHRGHQLDSGHYTATVLGPDKKWYTVSEANISEPYDDLSKVKLDKEETEYLLFYEEVSEEPYTP